jgi:hypothetical protein
VQVFTSSRRPDRSLDDCVESFGSERGIVTKVEVDVTLERAIGVATASGAVTLMVSGTVAGEPLVTGSRWRCATCVE